jgi:hypothetical protein
MPGAKQNQVSEVEQLTIEAAHQDSACTWMVSIPQLLLAGSTAVVILDLGWIHPCMTHPLGTHYDSVRKASLIRSRSGWYSLGSTSCGWAGGPCTACCCCPVPPEPCTAAAVEGGGRDGGKSTPDAGWVDADCADAAAACKPCCIRMASAETASKRSLRLRAGEFRIS